ncbi:hypothetical protein QZH41_015637 [Actinostola sp. cb2023]|nr:hypothetical protein QZH41_015637 [Actinostola sp. cb2023]
MRRGLSGPSQRAKGRAVSPCTTYSYELFELAHVLRVRPRASLESQNESESAGRCKVNLPPAHQPFIQTAVWHEDEYGCLLVLLCSNGTLLVWCVNNDEAPIAKQISWFQTAGRKTPKNSPWKDDDITKVPSQSTRSEYYFKVKHHRMFASKETVLSCFAQEPEYQPGSVLWWHTEDDFQMCIVGTELGEVMFVDLCSGVSILSVDLKESVTALELLQDKQHQITSVMIVTTSGETWQLILESKSLPQRKLSVDKFNSPSAASGMGYEMVGLMGIPLESFQAISEWQDRLVPMPVKSPMGEVQFSVQHARNQVFIGAHNQRTDILQVYDTDVDHLPMFIYQLPTGTSEFILTDRLMFAVVHADHGKVYFTLYLIKSTCRNVSVNPKITQKEVTFQFVFFISVSPENLFLDLAINNTDNTAADMLAITTGLDVNMLYEMAAKEALRQSKYEHAMKLYQLSKCPFSRRVAQFAKHNRVGDILTYLRQALSKHSDFHTAERKQLSNFALYCFVQQILEYSGQIKKQKELSEMFSQFINDNFDYDQFCALKLLASHGLKDHMFDVAKARGLMVEALDILYQTGQLHLTPDLLNKLAARGFTDVVSKGSKGAFLYTMDPNEAVNFLLTKPETILSHLKFLLSQLVALEEESLVHIARVLDPSRPSFRSLLSKIKTLPKSRSVSGSSMASLMSLESTASFTMEDIKLPCVADLLHLFLCCLLVLNHKREQRQDPAVRITNIKYVCGPPKSPTHSNSRKQQGTLDMLCQQVKLSCGQQHTAVISSSGDVYTWGKSYKGRLGHGDLIEEEGRSIPFRVEILHMHRIQVLSVACGIEHTLALCRDGVYAWGSSEYGQLGQGDNRQHTRPVFITELSDKSCIAIICGHYHSLALSADQRVWSWGWGVHGQLGMGSIEDVLLPNHVTSLDDMQVAQMAAGYSHTAILTAEVMLSTVNFSTNKLCPLCRCQGQVFTFGGGLYGQLGLGKNSKHTLPRLVESLKNEHISLLCCGSFETIAVTSDQKVFNWGRNPHYVRLHMKPEFRTKRLIGQGSSSSSPLSHRLLPTEMNCAFDSRIVEIHCGNLHYMAVTESGEVFTWGFNDHGQLGYGSKMEEQFTSKAVPSLKDKHIATASVGAEFSVAMDTAGQVLVWGRADSGQLGLDASLIGSAKEVPNPVALKSLPLLSSDESPSLSEASHSTLNQYLMLTGNFLICRNLVISYVNQCTKGMLYGRESLTLALHALYLHYTANLMLRHCLDIKDYLGSSVIYSNLNHWSEALGVRLKFLSQCYKEVDSTMEKNIVLEHAVNVINHSLRYALPHVSASAIEVLTLQERTHSKELLLALTYFRIIEEKDAELYGYAEQLQHMLQEILNFWAEQTFPQRELENILNVHLIKIAYPLSLLIIRNSAINQHQGQATSTGMRNNFLKLQFSGEFLTTVVKLVANEIQPGEDGKEYQEDLSLLSSSSGNEKNDTRHVDFTIGTSEENPMSPNQLILGIMENLKKDLDKCSSISLSMTTAATIAAAAVSQQREGRHGNSRVPNLDMSPDVVVFTCNHQFPRVYFMENILPEFQQRMSELLIPLLNITKTLVTHYKKSESNLLAACPVCVYNSLRSVQMEQASDTVLINGLRAKQWDI